MSPSFRQPTIIPVALLSCTMLALLLPAAGALGEGAPHPEVPGYPKYGCYDVIVGGNGMWGGNTLYPITVDVPGPVVDAYLVWIGTEDVGAPNSPNQSDLTVNGAGVLGQLVDQYQPGPSDPPWYMWRADIGPSGQNMVSQGVNKYTMTG